MVSRSRNRDNMQYHILSAIFSNGISFLTLRELILQEISLGLFIPYTLGTVLGSVLGVKISMFIEKRLDASSDGHLRK